MINAIGRVDYLKLLKRADWDEGQRWINFMQDCFQQTTDGTGLNHAAFSVRVVPPIKGDPQQRKGYVFECWGEASHAFLRDHHFAIQEETVSRIDYREEVQATREGLDVLGDEVSARRTHWNVTRYNKRPAQKTAGRDSGGYGLQIGSRKSERSMVAYKRGREAGAVEFRVTGDSARMIYKMAKADALNRAHEGVNVNALVITEICYRFGLSAAAFVSETTGLTTSEFADMIAFDPSTMPEVKQAMVERDLFEAWEQADEAVQMSFLNSILLRANGGKR